MPPPLAVPALILSGPTACGKSAVALALARALAPQPVEIISVDSALVYRGMDIGTAKPTARERQAVPHHLIDLLDPREAYSAARFVHDAQAAAADIARRGALPLLVGGTMLYLKALRQGLDTLPAADADVRAQIDARAAERGWAALHAELQRIDPATAARLAPGDSQRIQRALEVWHLTGRALSTFHGHATPMQPDWPIVSLEPESRAWLHARIAQRFDAMLDAGLVDEVRRLRERGDLSPALPALRCVGYRQTWAALDEEPQLCPGSPGWDALREAGNAATRQLAKRQLTWLRSMTDRHVVACDGDGVLEQVLANCRELQRQGALR